MNASITRILPLWNLWAVIPLKQGGPRKDKAWRSTNKQVLFVTLYQPKANFQTLYNHNIHWYTGRIFKGMPPSKVKNILIPVSCLFRGSIQHVLKLISHHEMHSTEGVQDKPLWNKNYLELKAFENRFFFFFELSYLPKSRASQKNSVVINTLPWSFTTRKDWLLPLDGRSQNHT